jgi:hypothetical protein
MDQLLALPIAGGLVLQVEGLVRTALFRKGTDIVGHLLQATADRIDAANLHQGGKTRKGREAIQVQCLFGTFPLQRDYYYRLVRGGHYPADEVLGLEAGHIPALVRLACLEPADEPGFEKAEKHLLEAGGIPMDARQIQRLVQRVGSAGKAWPQREYESAHARAPIMYVSADGTGVPMRPEELEGRDGKQADGTAKTRQAYLGCVFTQHKVDEKGRPYGIGRPPRTFLAWKTTVNSARCCARKLCAGALPMPPSWCFSLTEPLGWRT